MCARNTNLTHKDSVRIGEWLRINLRFLAKWPLLLIFRAIPCKPDFINALGSMSGLIVTSLKPKCWHEAFVSAQRIKPEISRWVFALKCFAQQGRDRAWILYCEDPGRLMNCISIEGDDLLKNAMRDRGAILLGAHYGPTLYAYMFQRMGIGTKLLTRKEAYDRRQRYKTLGIAAIQTQLIKSMRLDDYVPTEGSLIALARQVKKGGAVFITIDSPRLDAQGEPASIFGRTTQISRFPFKLALKNKAAVFFCCFERSNEAEYCLRFTPLEEFTTPAEGVQLYIELLSDRLERDPFMWKGTTTLDF